VLTYQFVQYALWAALFTGIISGIMGTLITEKHRIMMTGGIAHASFAGIGLGYFLNIEPLVPALGVSAVVVLTIKKMEDRMSHRADTIMGMLWALGMALGMIFVGLRPGYPPDMTSYLFGDILTISRSDLIFMACASLAFLLIYASRFEHWKVILFDEEHARLMGLPVEGYKTVFYLSIGVAVIAMIKVVGIILTLAILTTPSMTAQLFTRRLISRMIMSAIFAWITITTGFALSFQVEVPSGAMIIFVSVLAYAILVGFNFFKKRLAIRD
jgi:zinc transport system permease protein